MKFYALVAESYFLFLLKFIVFYLFIWISVLGLCSLLSSEHLISLHGSLSLSIWNIPGLVYPNFHTITQLVSHFLPHAAGQRVFKFQGLDAIEISRLNWGFHFYLFTSPKSALYWNTNSAVNERLFMHLHLVASCIVSMGKFMIGSNVGLYIVHLYVYAHNIIKYNKNFKKLSWREEKRSGLIFEYWDRPHRNSFWIFIWRFLCLPKFFFFFFIGLIYFQCLDRNFHISPAVYRVWNWYLGK